MKRLLVLVACVSLGFAGVACSEGDREEAAEDVREAGEDAYEEGREAVETAADRAEDVVNDRTVRIDDFKFDPASRTVKVGTEVTWINRDSATHTVTADNGSFESENLDTDKEFSFRFTQAGEFDYHCEIHGEDRMSGTVLVES
jgi:plastocyanin